MVYIELNGRVGNHLFQIATGASYAKKFNLDFCVICHDGYKLAAPDNCYIKDYVKQFQGNIFRNFDIRVGRPGNESYYYYENGFEYKEIPFLGNDVLLYGAFQSEKYFDKELVRSLYSVTSEIKDYIFQKYGDILKKGVTAINVRRGDYCKQPHKYLVCSMSYYDKAIDYIGRDNNYLIISDDIGWCKSHFKGDNFYFVDDEEPIIDLYIQTFCLNNIISNSSFSWWGAWLNDNPDKIVVYPDPWFGMYYKKNSIKDLIPEEWVSMPNNLSFEMKTKASLLMLGEKLKDIVPKSLKQFIKRKLR